MRKDDVTHLRDDNTNQKLNHKEVSVMKRKHPIIAIRILYRIIKAVPLKYFENALYSNSDTGRAYKEVRKLRSAIREFLEHFEPLFETSPNQLWRNKNG